MPTECVFTLSNGQKCRCAATRGYAFCRHHGAPRRPPQPAGPKIWNRLSAWRSLSHEMMEDPVQEAPGYMLNILQALLEDNVSDRYAGRYLRLLLKRIGALPFSVDPEFEQPPVALPPAPSPQPRTILNGTHAEIDQWIQSLLARRGNADVPRSQPSVDQSRPSTPSHMAVR